DPPALFLDVAGRKLSLAAASPALDSGLATLSQKLAPKIDIDGKLRPQGGGFDRGCFETGKGGLDLPGIDAGSSDPITIGGSGGATGSGGTSGTGGTNGVQGAGGFSGVMAGRGGASLGGGPAAEPSAAA